MIDPHPMAGSKAVSEMNTEENAERKAAESVKEIETRRNLGHSTQARTSEYVHDQIISELTNG